MQFLAAAMPLGPAPTTQMRLFETMTASPSIALFFAGLNHCQHYRFPPTCLILRRIDLPDKYMNNQRACLQVAGLTSESALEVDPLSRTIQRVGAPTGVRIPRRVTAKTARVGMPTVARIKPISSRSVIIPGE